MAWVKGPDRRRGDADPAPGRNVGVVLVHVEPRLPLPVPGREHAIACR